MADQNSQHEQNEIELIDKIFLRTVLTSTDAQLEIELSKHLVPVISKLSKSENVRKKVMEMLVHVNRRVKDLTQIQLPVDQLLTQFKNSQAPFVTNFSIMYIKMGFPRLDENKQVELLPELINCLEGKSPQQQESLFALMMPVFRILKMGNGEKTASLFNLRDRPALTKLLVDYMTDLLILPYGAIPLSKQTVRSTRPGRAGAHLVQMIRTNTLPPLPPAPPVPGVPSGMSIESFKKVCSESWVSETLENTKVSLVKFLGAEVLPISSVVLALLVASSDTRYSVTNEAESCLKRLESVIDYDNSSLVESVYDLFLGTPIPIEKVPKDKFKNPSSTRIRLKLLTFLLKSKEATNNYAYSVLLFRTCIEDPKLKPQAIKFLDHISFNANKEKLAPHGHLYFLGILSVIEENVNDTKVRSLAYVAFARLLIKLPDLLLFDVESQSSPKSQSSPQSQSSPRSQSLRSLTLKPSLLDSSQSEILPNSQLDFLQPFLKALLTERGDALLSVQEALSMMAPVWKQMLLPEAHTGLCFMLRQQISHQNSQLRRTAVNYAATVFSPAHVASRFILLLGTGDSQDEIRSEAKRQLYSSKKTSKDGSQTYEIPHFSEMITYVDSLVHNLDKSEWFFVANQIVPYNIIVMDQILIYLEHCIVVEATGQSQPNGQLYWDNPTKVKKFLSGLFQEGNNSDTNSASQAQDKAQSRSVLDMYISFAELAASAWSSVALESILKIVAIIPDKMVPKYSDRIDWIKKFVMRGGQYGEIAAHLYGVVCGYLNDDVTFEKSVKQLLRIKDYRMESQESAVLALGHCFFYKFFNLRNKIQFISQNTFTLYDNAVNTIMGLVQHDSKPIQYCCIFAIGEMVRSSPLLLPLEAPNDAPSLTKLVEILQGFYSSSKFSSKVREQAIATLGYLCAGKTDFELKIEIIQHFLDFSKETKELEIHFAVGEALTNCVLNEESSAKNNLWFQNSAEVEENEDDMESPKEHKEKQQKVSHEPMDTHESDTPLKEKSLELSTNDSTTGGADVSMTDLTQETDIKIETSCKKLRDIDDRTEEINESTEKIDENHEKPKETRENVEKSQKTTEKIDENRENFQLTQQRTLEKGSLDWLLNELLTIYIPNSHPYSRQATCVWLLTILKRCRSSTAVQNNLTQIQAAFMDFLAENNELIQDAASKGLGLVYESCGPETRDCMVEGLVKTLTEGKSAFKNVTTDTKIFQEGELGKAPSGGQLSTYKELCSLATDLNQPELIYKFMNLANHNAVWNSKKGAAFGFSTLARQAGAQLEPYLPQIVPKLYRYQHDPTPKIQQPMTAIWNSLVDDNAKTISKFYDAILNDLLENMGHNAWRVRESCCNAVADLLRRLPVTRALSDPSSKSSAATSSSSTIETSSSSTIETSRVGELWRLLYRLRDDIKESVRLAAGKTLQMLSKCCIKACESTDAASKRLLAEVFPILLTDGITSPVLEVRTVSIQTLVKLCRSGGSMVRPHLPVLIHSLMEALSGLENQTISYAAVRLDEESREQLDMARISASKSSPIMDTLNYVLQYIDKSVIESVVSGLIDVLKRSVGLSSRAAAAHVVVTLTHICPTLLENSSGKILSTLMHGLMDRNIVIRKVFANAIGNVIKTAKPSSIDKLLIKLQSWYLEKEDDAARLSAACALRSMHDQNGDVMKNHSCNAMPLVFLAMHASKDVDGTDPTGVEVWDEIWTENSPGTEAGIRLYLSEILAICELGLKSSNWGTKAQTGKALSTVSKKVGSTLNESQVMLIFSLLMQGMQGRTWTGKENITTALSDFALNTKNILEKLTHTDTNTLLLDQIVEVLVKEAKKENQEYKIHAIRALTLVLKEFKMDRFEEVFEICSPFFAAKTDKDSKETDDILDQESASVKWALIDEMVHSLGRAWPIQVPTQERFSEHLIEVLSTSIKKVPRKTQLSVVEALKHYWSKHFILEGLPSTQNHVLLDSLLRHTSKIFNFSFEVAKFYSLKREALFVLNEFLEKSKNSLVLISKLKNEILSSVEECRRDTQPDVQSLATSAYKILIS